MTHPLFGYVLGLGDDALVAAQRLAGWCASAPEMEEDVALTNIALDQLGAARLLLSYAGELEGAGRDEDALAYLRDDRQFRNCLLVELPDRHDFGTAIAKLLFLAAYQKHLYDALAGAADERLAAIAGNARKESAYHLDHAARWTIRLGDGTDESHRRMQAAVDEVWPYTDELFAGDETVPVDPATLRPAWSSTVEPVRAQRPAHRAPGVPARRDAGAPSRPPGSDVVSRVHDAVARVVDPELRVVTIEELGILRDVQVAPRTGQVVVTIRPTYSGCPALDAIRADIAAAARAAGHPDVQVLVTLAPPWTSDDISGSGRAKLAAAGIAPPPARVVREGAVPVALSVRCPRCGSPEAEEISHFGSTACKALWRCRSCAEPFEHVKVR